MNVKLTSNDEAILRGRDGPGAQMAMSIVIQMAEISEAESLLDISAAHIDSTIYIGQAGLEFAERLVALGAHVSVPSTANVSAVDENHWREWSVPAEWAELAQRQMIAYSKLGCQPTWTCAPYQSVSKPAFGQQIAWGESNAIVFANSVLGARTERYPDLLDICCAIVGRAPATGLHLTENRSGQLLIRLQDIPRKVRSSDAFFPVLGHLIGLLAGDRIPVIDGISEKPTEDELKAFGAAAASSGAVALYHLVGITPEAPTLAAAFQGRIPQKVIDLTLSDLRKARDELTTAMGDRLDMVVLGSPHFSLGEFAQLVPLIQKRKAHPDVQFLITTSRAVAHLAEKSGFLETFNAFGGKLTVDTCILASPMLPPEIEILMSNSAKYAYYTPGLLNKKLYFGTLAECVNSAVSGTIERDDSLWEP